MLGLLIAALIGAVAGFYVGLATGHDLGYTDRGRDQRDFEAEPKTLMPDGKPVFLMKRWAPFPVVGLFVGPLVRLFDDSRDRAADARDLNPLK